MAIDKQALADAANAVLKLLSCGALIIAAGYVGTLWHLSRDQATQLEAIRIEAKQRVIDCAAAELVAKCSAADPFATCVATAEAAK